MGNMSYCRFRNALQDLQDCYDNFDEYLHPEEDKEEHSARLELLELCKTIVEEYGDGD